MKLETLRKLYITQLQDIYSTEKQIVASLPKMAKAASHPALKKGFKKHLVETEMQVKRLEVIFNEMGENPKGETSEPMIGLATEGQEIMHAKGDDNVLDAALIGAAQKIEHYEIASYGTVIAYAKLLGDQRAIQLLKLSLAEEKATDRRLTELAEKMINKKAAYSYARERGTEHYGPSDDGGLSFSALLLGALAGVAAGMLLAPTAGEDARRKLVEGASSFWDQWGGKLGGLADATRSTYNKVVGQPQETNGNGGPLS